MVEHITNFFNGKNEVDTQEIKKNLNSILCKYREVSRAENKLKLEKDEIKKTVEKLLSLLKTNKYKDEMEGTISIFQTSRKVLDIEKLKKDFPNIKFDAYMKETKYKTIKITPKNV